jgi:hypothetical protein
MIALKKEAAFSPSSTAGLGPDPMPRIERKIAAFMGGRRCERGTTAVLLRRAAPRLCCAAVSVRAATVAGKGDPSPLGFLLLVRLHSAASSSARPSAHMIPGTPQESPSVHRLFESSQISPRFAPQNWPPHVGGIKAGIEISLDKEIPRPKNATLVNVSRRLGIRLAFPFLN